MEDWRLQGQEHHLRSATLKWTEYSRWSKDWNHDHCEFCWAKFSMREEDLHAGYTTLDNYHWICETCFRDFKEKFEWSVIGS
jgi:hypothetical protein